MLVLEDRSKVLPADAARILDLTPQRVRQLVDTGRLPAERIMGVRVISRAAVEALAKERARKRAKAQR
jgi:hypothetical protein